MAGGRMAGGRVRRGWVRHQRICDRGAPLRRRSTRRVSATMTSSREASATGSAADFIPPRASLSALRASASACRGCHLWMGATQTVFGEGPRTAEVMLVGEQPGDQEDRQGHPFVGPSGRLLDEALEAAGIDRRRVYVTNAVKHFKFVRIELHRSHAHVRAPPTLTCPSPSLPRPWPLSVSRRGTAARPAPAPRVRAQGRWGVAAGASGRAISSRSDVQRRPAATRATPHRPADGNPTWSPPPEPEPAMP